jgi:hypothetical protein
MSRPPSPGCAGLSWSWSLFRVLCATTLRTYRVARSQPDVPVSRALAGLTPPPVPGPLRVRVHPLLSFTSPSESVPLRTCPALSCVAPPLEFLSPSRHQLEESTCERASHSRPTVRPRRFSRPRRLAPHRALRVYFTPQPRPGFTSQGFCPAAQPLAPRRRPVPSCRFSVLTCLRVAPAAPAPPAPASRS